MRHIGEIHRYDPALVIRCGIDHCPQTYKNYESFRSHIYCKHREVLHSQSSDACDESECIDITNSTENYEQLQDDDNQVMAAPDIKKIGAKFLLKTREEHRIPQLTLNKIISDVKGLWMSSMDFVRKDVRSFMLKSNTEAECSPLFETFDDYFPLSGLETEYMQLKYYKENFNYLVRMHVLAIDVDVIKSLV